MVKRAQTIRKTGRKIKLKTTGNELVVEWDAMKQSKQFPFCHRRTIFLSLGLADCHSQDGLRPWLTCLSGPLGDHQNHPHSSSPILKKICKERCKKIVLESHIDKQWLTCLSGPLVDHQNHPCHRSLEFLAIARTFSTNWRRILWFISCTFYCRWVLLLQI